MEVREQNLLIDMNAVMDEIYFELSWCQFFMFSFIIIYTIIDSCHLCQVSLSRKNLSSVTGAQHLINIMESVGRIQGFLRPQHH